jgi:hypothetical protein
LVVKAMASFIGGQDGLVVGVATEAVAATDENAPVGKAAFAELNCKAAPVSPPSVMPPTSTEILVIFIVAHTTLTPRGWVRIGWVN